MGDCGHKICALLGITFVASLILLMNFVQLDPPSDAEQSGSASADQRNPLYPGVDVQPLSTLGADPDGWSHKFLPNRLQTANQRNPILVEMIRRQWILKPKNDSLHLANSNKTDHSQFGQSSFLDKYLHQKRDGFYVECGAFDGELFSDSLFFERHRSWKGLLIEANPNIFKSLLSKNRHAYALNSCLSPTTRPMRLNFSVAGLAGGIPSFTNPSSSQAASFREVQCLPLQSILWALGGVHVDFLALDVEGSEFQVLQSVDYNRVDVDVFLIDTKMANKELSKYKREMIEGLLTKYGYHRVPFRAKSDLIMSRLPQ